MMDCDHTQHGTRTGYNTHIRLKEKPCDPCRLDHNKAQREYRQSNLAAQKKARIYQKALAELRDNHRKEWNAIRDQLLLEEGL